MDWSFLIRSLSEVISWLPEITSSRSSKPLAVSLAYFAASLAALVASAEATAPELFNVSWTLLLIAAWSLTALSILPCSFVSAASRAAASLASCWFSWVVMVPMFLLMLSKPLATFWFTCSMTLSWALSAPMRAAVSVSRAFDSLSRSVYTASFRLLIRSFRDLSPFSRAVASVASASWRAFVSLVSASWRAAASLASCWFSWVVMVPMFLLMLSKPLATFWFTCSMTLSWALSAPMRAAVSVSRAFDSLSRSVYTASFRLLIRSFRDLSPFPRAVASSAMAALLSAISFE